MKIALTAAGLMLVVSLLAAMPFQQAPPPAAGLTGTWEVADQPYGPWIFNLETSGNKVTGRIWQEGGVTDPVEIIEGRADGANVIISYQGFSRATRAQRFFPNLVPPARGQNLAALNATVRITLTGVLRNDEISFTSKVDDPNGLGNVGPFGANNVARGQVAAVRPAVAMQMGLFGALIPQKFTVKRATPAVAGRISVDAMSVPRPVFQLTFVSASGRRIGPPTRDVWNAPGPRTAMEAVNRPLGSAFDAVARTETNTLPGNPPTFVVRLPAGEYRPTVAGLPDGFVVQSIRSGGVDLTSNSLKIVDGSVPAELTIVLGLKEGPPWGKLSGKVLNASTRVGERGGNIGGIAPSLPTAVVLANRAFSEFWIAPLQTDGSFDFPRILPGDYELHGFPDTPATPVVKVTVPAAANLNVDVTAPDVKALPCPAC